MSAQQPSMVRPLVAAGLLLALLLAACAGSGSPSIEPAELAARIAGGSAPFVLDVRSSDEFAAGHIPGAVNVPHTELAERLGSLGLASDTEIVVHCQSGRRAAVATDVLTDAGFVRVVELEGHWADWSAAGLPRE
jgi:rhodanese-related sulfurtransferase